MKKLLKIALVLLLTLSTTIVSAQTKTVKSTTKKSAITAKTTSAGPTKKDGTPDMRYKTNSTTKTTVGPTKKDGSADMRYKANKTTTSTTKKSTTKH